MARLINGADMVDMVRDMCGGETNAVLSKARILKYINQSYFEIAGTTQGDLLDGSATITTSDGTGTYTFTSDNVFKIKDLTDSTNDNLLYSMNQSQYNSWTQGGDVSGEPMYWFINGADTSGKWKVTFFPTPAGAYTILADIITKPDPITADVDGQLSVCITHELWDDSIIYRAAARGWALLGDTKLAREYRSLARDNDRVARKMSTQASETPNHMTSAVGGAIGRV